MRKVTDFKDYQRIRDEGAGYVYNDFSPSGIQGDFNILHLTSCRYLEKSNLTYDKYFFNTMNEAKSWLDTHRGENWRKCMKCLTSQG